MKVSQAKELFRELTKSYFAGATVAFAQQSRAAKSKTPLVSIRPGNVKRPLHPTYKMQDGVQVGSYLSRISMTVDLFTNGTPVIDDETGKTVAYENTAIDDMLGFADFLGSQYAIEWCNRNDVSILIEGDAQDLTGIVNDNNYEFRSRLVVMFYFTQRTIGSAAVLSEESILYPTEEKDETGEPIYTPKQPAPTTSTTGTYPGITEEDEAERPIIEPVFEVSPSGGGTQELADTEAGYFTEVEIKEDTGNE